MTIQKWNWGLYGRWILANAIAEMLGLGITFLLGLGFMSALEITEGLAAALGIAGLAIVAGTLVEGIIVGTAQWMVLRRRLPGLTWASWAAATALGALIAWTLGMLPSTLLSAASDPSSAPAPEMSDALTYALAAGMGLVLGPILALAQWLRLRRHVRAAGWWVPANALAWAAGMVVVFAGVGGAATSGEALSAAIGLLAALAIAGAIVGAIHGAVLVWLLAGVVVETRP